jgi:hypothetical protein
MQGMSHIVFIILLYTTPTSGRHLVILAGQLLRGANEETGRVSALHQSPGLHHVLK